MKYLILIFTIILLFACKSAKTPIADTTTKTSSKERAQSLAKKYIIVDGHVDLPYRLNISNFKFEKEYIGIPIETDKGDFDYKRSKAGGLDAPFMSIYIPADRQKEYGASKKHAETLIDLVEGICNTHPDKFVVAHNAADVQKAFNEGKIALPMGMENGSGIEDDISNVEYFRNKGISYITLTHSKDNLICDSSYDTTGTWGGLSPFGEEVVREMNRVGIMVDISHVSDEAFYDAVKISNVPVIASHSSCRKFTPGFVRNMSDDLLLELGKNGGVIMINFGSTFIDSKSRAHVDSTRKLMRKSLKKLNLSADSEEGKKFINHFQKENPVLFSDVKTVADHIDHVVKLIGVDHVGFGSDFDGVGDSLPVGLKDVADYPNLIWELLQRGYSEDDIEKICYGNLFRVWQAVENYASAN